MTLKKVLQLAASLGSLKGTQHQSSQNRKQFSMNNKFENDTRRIPSIVTVMILQCDGRKCEHKTTKQYADQPFLSVDTRSILFAYVKEWNEIKNMF